MHSWWIVLIGGLFFGLAVFGEWYRGHRQRRKQAEDAQVPVSTSPPKLLTKGDHFIANEVAPMLREGEEITHQAYALSREMRSAGHVFNAQAYFAALTDERLILIKARIGALRPLLENRGVETIERSLLQFVLRLNQQIVIGLADESSRTLWVNQKVRKYFSNQEVFLRDVPRLLATEQKQRPSASRGAFQYPSRFRLSGWLVRWATRGQAPRTRG